MTNENITAPAGVAKLTNFDGRPLTIDPPDLMRYLLVICAVCLFVDAATAQTVTQPAALTTANRPVTTAPGSTSGGKGFLGGLIPDNMKPTVTLPSATLPTADIPGLKMPDVMSSTALSGGRTVGVDELFTSVLPDLGLKLKQLRKAKETKYKQKKLAKTEYEGLPMVKAYTKFGSGDRTVVEEFHVLRGDQEPGKYARELTWYDSKAGRVGTAVLKDKSGIYWLHGPYKRYQNGNLIEEGNYYVGTKDGRWEKYDANFMLTDKTRWLRGFPAESRIAYFDSAHTKIREVMPVLYGKVTGQYLRFFETGQVAEEGKYDNGVKIGRWTDYYLNPTRRFRQRVTQYARDQWDTDFEPVVITEWAPDGKATYERPREKTVVQESETEN
jgi:antitoxin component YwqK of YwqJK toxin-antitoxin module